MDEKFIIKYGCEVNKIQYNKFHERKQMRVVL